MAIAKLHQYDAKAALGPNLTLATNVDRHLLEAGAGLISGRLELTAIYIPGGASVASIGFWASTGATTPTHQIFGIYNLARQRQCFTTDDTTTDWFGNALKVLTLSGGAWVCPASEMYYAAVMVTGATPPVLYGHTLINAALSSGSTPPLCGTSDTGLTTTIPATSAAIADGTAFRGAWLF